MYGWTGTTLRVNLTNGDISKEPTNMENARNYFGAQKYYMTR
jgi:aldehyde:ferredoxin oxidoreductase